MNEPQQAKSPSSFPKKQLLLIALIQGLLLYWLYRAHEDNFWPATQPVVEFVLITLALAVPTLLLLSVTDDNRRRIYKVAGGFAVLLTLLASYVGWQLEPRDIVHEGSIVFAYGLTILLLLFKTTIYSQVWAKKEPLSYRALFHYSWRNTLLMAVNLVFVQIFWLILMLWALLFKVVDIDFFEDLFKEPWFLFPTLSLVYGLAFCIFRDLVKILDTVARVLQALCQFLLPLLVFIALLFLATLPFVGLSALWNTGSGTTLVLWLLVLVLFFVNAVYQDEQKSTPYWRPLHRLVYAGVMILPIYSLIACYGMYLRVEQYGLTMERCWALLITLLLSMFAFAYSGAIIKYRSNWVGTFRYINVGMGLFFLVLMAAVNSPFLDFRKLSLSSQVNRLESGEIGIDKLDINYIARNLGRPGYLYLEELKKQGDITLNKRIANAYYSFRGNDVKTDDEIQTALTLVPETLVVPEELQKKILQRARNNRTLGEILLFQLDLNNDGVSEWIQITEMNGGNWSSSEFWYFEKNDWQVQYFNTRRASFLELRESIMAGEISTTPHKWQSVQIGEANLTVPEWN